MEYPSYQPYSEYQSHEFYPPTYQPDYSSHYPSYPSQPYQTCPPEAGNYCLTTDEGWQPQNTQFYPDQTCPDQPQYQPQPQQNFKPTSEENHNANSAAGETEGVTVFQQNVRSCTKSEAKLIMEMQHTHEEQQSHMDSMIRQVALMTEMIKEVKENRAKPEVNRSTEMEEGMRKTEGEEPTDAERKSEALLEGAGTTEIESDEEEKQSEEKSMTSPQEDKALREIPEEAHDGPQKKEEEAIERDEEIDNTLFYPQPDKVHAPEEKVKEFTIMVKEESTQAEKPPPVIDESEGCSYEEEEEPECMEEERSRRKAARAIYWVQLQPWPEPQRMGKPPHSGVRPKENKKVKGTYRHHRKKRDAMLVMIPQKIQWVAKRRV